LNTKKTPRDPEDGTGVGGTTREKQPASTNSTYPGTKVALARTPQSQHTPYITSKPAREGKKDTQQHLGGGGGTGSLNYGANAGSSAWHGTSKRKVGMYGALRRGVQSFITKGWWWNSTKTYGGGEQRTVRT